MYELVTDPPRTNYDRRPRSLPRIAGAGTVSVYAILTGVLIVRHVGNYSTWVGLVRTVLLHILRFCYTERYVYDCIKQHQAHPAVRY